MQSRLIFIIGAVVVIAIGAGLWWWESSTPPVAPKVETVAPATTPAPVDEAEVPVTPAVQRPVLPALDASDAFVREQAGALSGQLAEWLTQDDLVRRFAVVVDNATSGDYPRRQLGFLAPPEKFPVLQKDNRIFVDPEGYHRFDHFVDVVVSVDAKRAAVLLDNLTPLLVLAMKELGQAAPDPIVAMHKSIDQVLATPVVDGDVELVQPKVFYLYADPKLESLKPLQKQLLRMGPQNLQRLKTYLTQVNSYL
jgi:hypothetical protein